MASYPEQVRSFVPLVDRVDVNDADDLNDLQRELTATQRAVGRNPAVSEAYPSAATLAERVLAGEQDVLPRLKSLEQRMRRASVNVRRASELQVNSSTSWQPLVMPDVVATLNDFGDELYNAQTGRFFSVAPAPAIWNLSASVSWYPPDTNVSATGVRGLAVVTAGGTVLAMDKQVGIAGEPTTLSVEWTGRLTADPNHYLTLMVKQNQGEALFLYADGGFTPTRADFTHIPG